MKLLTKMGKARGRWGKSKVMFFELAKFEKLIRHLCGNVKALENALELE